ncbi:MAG: UDP-N-acetylmuramate dehydrogenase [Desulfobacteraceae bacterium]|nr:UDP-N-acetylmuramate dehydrogenase [Desulfobacteraceae bacterium]
MNIQHFSLLTSHFSLPSLPSLVMVYSKKWLKSRFGTDVKFDEPMSGHTSLRVGGTADAFVSPGSIEDLSMLVNWSCEKGIEYTIIGGGTNLLVKDRGIRGIVIVLTNLNKITHAKTEKNSVTVKAMAGVRMKTLCSFAIRHGLEGMNLALGIPGTVGGGIMMNAGTAYGSMENILDSVKILLPTGQTQRIKKHDLKFDYRKLDIPAPISQFPFPIILDGCFNLRTSDAEKIKKQAELIVKTRKRKQPTNYPSAGSFFKNPVSGKTAGELIDKAGLKGIKLGGAEVSEKHANFIINRNRASASDIISLMELIQETVSGIFNVDLEPEVKIIGE